MRVLLLALLGLGLLAAGDAAAGMSVGAQVCTEAIPGACLGACVETPLSPPDLCPTVRLPI